MKHKFQVVTGCTCFSYTVDGKEFNIELSEEERKDVVLRLMENESSSVFLRHIASDVYECGKSYEKLDDLIVGDDYDAYYAKIEELLEIFTNKDISAQKEELRGYIEDCEYIGFYHDVFTRIVQDEGKYEHLGVCECCGDTIEKWTLNLEY